MKIAVAGQKVYHPKPNQQLGNYLEDRRTPTIPNEETHDDLHERYGYKHMLMDPFPK